jgi:probable phosphoglycerate mutase
MIYLVRHGQTVWNAEGRLQGQLDSPLTKRGFEQADKIGLRLANELRGLGDRVRGQVSPLGRARQTAERLRRFVRVEFAEEPRLAEVTLGSWDGMTADEIGAEYPGALSRTDGVDWQFRSPDGETFDRARGRVESWLSSVAAPTLAVSHGLLTRLIRGVYLGLTRDEMLQFEVSQDGFLVLDDGAARFLDLSAS